MRRRRQRHKGKRRQHAVQSRDRLLNLIYDVHSHPLEHRQIYASHFHKISRRHRLRFTKKAKEVEKKVKKSQNSDLGKVEQTSQEKPKKSKTIKKQSNQETKKKTPRSGWWSRNK